MSYVIQNFNNSCSLALTPKIKLILFLKNKDFIFYLLKYFYKIFNFKYCNISYVFYKIFFKNTLFKLKNLISIKLLNYYKNTFSLSLVYWNLLYICNFKNNLKNSDIFNYFNVKEVYLIPVKTFPAFFRNKFFKILFFNFIFYLFNVWSDFNINFNFNISFFFINYNFQLYKFYNGPFFKIYNN